MWSLRIFLFCLPALLPGWSFAQNNDVPFQRDIYRGLELKAANRDARVHSGLKPLIERRADLSATMGYAVDSAKYYFWYTEKLYRDHLLQVRQEDVRISVDPLFQFELGFDPGDRTAYSDTNRYYQNTRGFLLRGDIGERFSFQTMFHETQALVPQYLFRYVERTGAMPGQARVKIQERRELDFGWSQANISYSPAAWINVQFGHGKHFVGHGYRSMLLSDNALNAPYLKFSALFLKQRVQYSTWHTKHLGGLSRTDRLPTGDAAESLLYWYRARFNHLSVDLGRVQLGLFEATLFRTIDSAGVLPFDAMELNPIIGLNTLLKAGAPGSSRLIGADMRVKLTDRLFAYGQVALSEALAWQAGLRAFDLGVKGFDLQFEYNSADPYAYMNDPAELAYQHGSLPLAHPLGTHFQEAVLIAEQTVGRARLQVRATTSMVHRDPEAASAGADIALPLPSVRDTVQATALDLFTLDANVSYLFNSKTNLRALIGVMRRDLPGTADNFQSSYIYLAVRTGLFNRYYDL